MTFLAQKKKAVAQLMNEVSQLEEQTKNDTARIGDLEQTIKEAEKAFGKVVHATSRLTQVVEQEHQRFQPMGTR